MRLFLLVAAMVFGWGPALQAADWKPFANARFGYVIDMPPGFAMQRAPDNGDGGGVRALTFQLGKCLPDLCQFDGGQECLSLLVDIPLYTPYRIVRPKLAGHSKRRNATQEPYGSGRGAFASLNNRPAA